MARAGSGPEDARAGRTGEDRLRPSDAARIDASVANDRPAPETPAVATGAPMDHERPRRVHPRISDAASALQAGVRSRRSFLRTATLLGLSAGVAGAWASQMLGAGGAARAEADALSVAPPVPGGRLRCAMVVMRAEDPAQFSWVEMSNIVRHQHEHLTITGADNVTRPMLAERWTVSDDLKTWTLHIRPGVLWRNGDAFDVDDVLFNVRRWLDPETGSSTRALLSALPSSGLERVDAMTLRLHLDRPLLSLPENLYNYPTAIVHRGFSGDVVRDRNGTGAFEIVEHAPGEISISRRVRSDDRPYWGETVAHIGPGLLDEIAYVDPSAEPSLAEPAAAIADGVVDLTYETDLVDARPAEASEGVVVRFADSAQTGCMRMRIDAPPFDDVRVRRALQLCCDPGAFPAQVFGGRGRPAEHHHVSPIHPEYFALPTQRQRIQRARELLGSAGHADGLDVSLVVGETGGPWQMRAAQLFAEQAAEGGVRVAIDRVSPERYREVWRTTPFGFTQWAHRPLGTMALSLGYRSGAVWNETGYSNMEFDAVLDEAEAQFDLEPRRRRMAALQRMLQSDAVMVQPVWAPAMFLASARIRALPAHPSGYHQFNGVWMDPGA